MRVILRHGAAVLVLLAWGAAAAQAGEGIAVLLPRPGLGALEAQVSGGPPPARPPAAVHSIYKAALLSALVPGLGEYWSGHRHRAVAAAGLEGAVWTSFITFKVQENLRADRAAEYAVAYAGARPGAGDDYYKAVGQFLRAEGPGMWNEFVRRRARDTDETVGREYTGDEAWAWPSLDRFIDYRKLRREKLEAGDNATDALAFALLNRVLSVASVVQAVRSDHRPHAATHGLRLEFDPQHRRVGLWERF